MAVKYPDQAAYQRRTYARNKTLVFEHYGTSCSCCGSVDLLQIDHIAGGGKAHRKEVGGGGSPFYRWLVGQGFPAGYQTLCRPCNGSKNNGEFCRLHDGQGRRRQTVYPHSGQWQALREKAVRLGISVQDALDLALAGYLTEDIAGR
jgi:hypothetical protein